MMFHDSPLGPEPRWPKTLHFQELAPCWISVQNASFCQRDEENNDRIEILDVPNSEPKTSSCLWCYFWVRGRKRKSCWGVHGHPEPARGAIGRIFSDFPDFPEKFFFEKRILGDFTCQIPGPSRPAFRNLLIFIEFH